MGALLCYKDPHPLCLQLGIFLKVFRRPLQGTGMGGGEFQCWGNDPETCNCGLGCAHTNADISTNRKEQLDSPFQKASVHALAAAKIPEVLHYITRSSDSTKKGALQFVRHI